MSRLMIIVCLCSLLAAPAAAQSRLESFRTALDASGSYLHRTSYSFTLPTRTAGHPGRVVDLDLYYNSRVVWLVGGRITCGSTSWGETTSDSHFVSLRTVVFTAGTTCTANLTFANNSGRNGPQSAALRINVSVEGMRTLSKNSSNAFGSAGRNAAAFNDAYRAIDLWRIAEKNALDNASQ